MPRFFSRLLLLSLPTLLFLGGAARAEITTPYTVDEKAQVDFGDATTVAGHYGLENYVYEYVGGYLHLTFTYTHSNCCFSSYPPEVYITAEDPRNTAAPTVRSSLTAYHLLAGVATDWYAYDIQFDATGYTVIVKKAGVTEIANTHETVTGQTDTDYAALANDFNLAPASNFSMSFTPRLVHEASASVSSAAASGARRSGHSERQRCVETTTGIYCPSEEVRRKEISERLEQMQTLIEILRRELFK